MSLTPVRHQERTGTGVHSFNIPIQFNLDPIFKTEQPASSFSLCLWDVEEIAFLGCESLPKQRGSSSVHNLDMADFDAMAQHFDEWLTEKQLEAWMPFPAMWLTHSHVGFFCCALTRAWPSTQSVPKQKCIRNLQGRTKRCACRVSVVQQPEAQKWCRGRLLRVGLREVAEHQVTFRTPWCPLLRRLVLRVSWARLIPGLESIIAFIIQIITKRAEALGSLDIHSSNSLCGRWLDHHYLNAS